MMMMMMMIMQCIMTINNILQLHHTSCSYEPIVMGYTSKPKIIIVIVFVLKFLKFLNAP